MRELAGKDGNKGEILMSMFESGDRMKNSTCSIYLKNCWVANSQRFSFAWLFSIHGLPYNHRAGQLD